MSQWVNDSGEKKSRWIFFSSSNSKKKVIINLVQIEFNCVIINTQVKRKSFFHFLLIYWLQGASPIKDINNKSHFQQFIILPFSFLTCSISFPFSSLSFQFITFPLRRSSNGIILFIKKDRIERGRKRRGEVLYCVAQKAKRMKL